MINHLFDDTFFFIGHKNVQVGSVSGSVINWPPGSGSISQDYGSADPGPEKNNYGSATLRYLEPPCELCFLYTIPLASVADP
jgi:hypothetical protein